jgi:PST family polysaccharide transporter
MVWAGVTMASSRIVTLIATLILARLLVPADFGVFAVGLLIINYFDRVKDMGVGAGLIYRREPWDRVARTGLPLVVVSSAVLSALAYALAPFAANFFDDQRIVGVLRGLALVLFISGVASVPDAKLRRGMDFRRRLVPELAASIVKNGVAVGLAWAGVGVMSLVWGQLVGTLVQAVLYWALCGWRPRIGWDPWMARALLRYGVPSSLVAVFSVFIENIDYLVVGHRLGPEQLGYYSMAYRLPELSILAVCITASQVFFPAFSRLQHDLPRLQEVYLRAARYIATFTLPVGAAMMVLAPEIVLALFGPRWEASIPVLRLIAVFAAISSMSFHAGELYKATGRPGILNTLAVGEIILLFPVLWVAGGHSIVAVAWAMCAGAAGLTVARLLIAAHIIQLNRRDLAGAFVPGLLIALGVAILDWVAKQAVSLVEPGLRPVIELAILGVLTVAGYFALLRWIAPDVVRYGLATVRSRLDRA